MDEVQSARSRRRFLKAAVVAGAAGAAVVGCSDKVEQDAVVRGKSPKAEVLYRGDTKYWQQYYKVAK